MRHTATYKTNANVCNKFKRFNVQENVQDLFVQDFYWAVVRRLVGHFLVAYMWLRDTCSDRLSPSFSTDFVLGRWQGKVSKMSGPIDSDVCVLT